MFLLQNTHTETQNAAPLTTAAKATKTKTHQSLNGILYEENDLIFKCELSDELVSLHVCARADGMMMPARI